MSPIVNFRIRLFVCAATMIVAQQAFAAVLILEGTPTPSAALPPAISGPAQDEPPAPVQSKPSLPTSPTESGILTPATAPATVTPPAAVTAPAMPPAGLTAPASPPASVDPGTSKVANSAEVSIEMMPGQTVSVGSRVSFRVTSKKAGYLVLVDVDATGHLTQIYPNTASLVRTSRANGNYIKPGGTLTIPLATDPYAGAVQYVVTPPNGQAMIVAILSAQPVQILDLPDVPPDINGQSGMLAFLSKWTSELRIPDNSSQLREARWSFNAKSYTIQ
jgi:hypothetical protein